MYSVIQGTKLCSLEALTYEEINTHKVPLCLPDPGDSICQLMVSLVLVTPKGLRFSVQFLTQGLFDWPYLQGSICG